MEPFAAVDLHWIPLGAGSSTVRFFGKIYEAFTASVHRRERCHLHHPALVVSLPEAHFAIETGSGSRPL